LRLFQFIQMKKRMMTDLNMKFQIQVIQLMQVLFLSRDNRL